MRQILASIVCVIVSFSALSQPALDECARYIKAHELSPEDYITSKFKKYDIVIMGEDHAIRQNLEFVAGLVPVLYKNGIYNIGMEFGAAEMQGQMDSLLSAPAYNAQAARDMMYYYNVGWPYEEYYSLCEVVWKFNKSLRANAPKFRIVNLSYQYDWSHFKAGSQRTDEDMRLIFPKGTPDKFRADIVSKEIMEKKQKALLLVGLPHAYTKYGYCYYDFLKDNFLRCDTDWLGQRIARLFPGKIFSVMLHQAFPNLSGKQPYMVSPADGMIEKAMAANGFARVGFDLIKSPLGALPDHSRHSVGYKDLTMDDIFDGYIFLVPFDKMEGCTVDEKFYVGKMWDNVKAQIPDPDWRGPIASLDDLLIQIRSFVNLKMRYHDLLKGD